MRPTTLFVVFTAGALGSLVYLGEKTGVQLIPDINVPELKMPDLKMPDMTNINLPQLSQQASQDSQPQMDANAIHKWQDREGQWHYSNTPPPKGYQSEIIRVEPNANVTPSDPARQSNREAPGQDSGQEGEQLSSLSDFANGLSDDMPSAMPASYSEAMKRVQQAKEAMENRPLPPP